MKNLIIISAVIAIVGLSMPAHAFHCPIDMKKIDSALSARPNLSAAQMSMVKDLRERGEALHKSGDHKGSVETLAKAMKLLGIK